MNWFEDPRSPRGVVGDLAHMRGTVRVGERLLNTVRSFSRIAGRLWQFFCISGLAISLTACGEDMLPTEITGYNHMTKPDGWSIGGFSVDGHGGANASLAGGAGNSCCMSLPRRWHPGMTVKVEWSYNHRAHDPDTTPPPPQMAMVEVPEYTVKNSGAMQVHFYPNHRVKVVVSKFGIEHMLYPMSEEDKKPWVSRKDWSKDKDDEK
ncbi:DUF3304 domain-containing protein [Variovorax sp. E3]|uniref:DUF3304 domain-containing protein n=1 Tax=Variovorax sp. E3 TaxID=1914993 RepID=UPI0018DC324C|nr:DUF3304 domain-containing protein [Variovorax sp. E3]